MGDQVRVVRVLGMLEPGGAQLSALRLSAALRRHGVVTTLLAGDATPAGLRLAARYGFAVDAFRVGEVVKPRSLQWTPEPLFADWLSPRLAPADLVHAHMVGAWWAAAQAVPPGVPLVASEHNQMSWPGRDHTEEARAAARRVDMLFCHGPSVCAWAAGLGLGGRPREGRSAVQGLSARPLAGLPSPRLTFTGRFRDRQGTRRARRGARPARHAPTCLPARRRPHARSAGPTRPGPRPSGCRALSRMVL